MAVCQGLAIAVDGKIAHHYYRAPLSILELSSINNASHGIVTQGHFLSCALLA